MGGAGGQSPDAGGLVNLAAHSRLCAWGNEEAMKRQWGGTVFRVSQSLPLCVVWIFLNPQM